MSVTRRTTALSGCALLVTLTGCSWTGPNSVPLPLTKGGDDDDLRVTVQLANATNLVPNSEVKYDEVTIGSVRKIELKDWTATLTIGIERDADVPADVTAKVAQKSLLGAEYLALEDPHPAPGSPSAPVDAMGQLETGDVIGLERTARYPETEEVLSAASMLLNGGGLSQVRTITEELNAALSGREDDVKSFLRTVSAFTGRLARQRDSITGVLHQLDRLSRTVTHDRGRIDTALTRLPKGLRVLESERAQLVKTLQAVDSFGKVAHKVIGGTKEGFQQNLANLRPITRELAANGKKLADSFDALSYPFNTRAVNRIVYGDYFNLVTTIEVSAGALTRDWLGGTPLDGLFTGFMGGTPTGPAVQATDPLSDDLINDLLGPLGGGILGGKPKNRGAADDEPATPEAEDSPGLLGQLLGGL